MPSITINHWSIGHLVESHFEDGLTTIVGGVVNTERRFIKQSWESGYNSAHGWSLKYNYTISAAKTVNAIRLLISPIDNLGRVAIDEIGRSKEWISINGPIMPGTTHPLTLDNIWFTVVPIKPWIEQAVFCYNDGTQETVQVYILNNYNDVVYFNNEISDRINRKNVQTKVTSEDVRIFSWIVGGFFLFMAFGAFLGGVASSGGVSENGEMIKYSIISLIIGLPILLWGKLSNK